MVKFTEVLFRQHGLRLPTELTKEQLVKWRLQEYYTCKWCGKQVYITKLVYSTDDYLLRCVCHTCAWLHEHADEIDDYYPPYGR